jgi:hypothetical protein
MDDKQRLQLQNMIKTNNVEDQTSLIRELKHSKILRNDVNNMVLIKEKYQDDYDKIYSECANECVFLFTYYTDVFNKIRKDEIDLTILYTFIDVLEKIENGELDQHEGSFMVGDILKKIYIDSALRKAEKLDEISDKPMEPKKAEIQISWREFKNIQK